MTVSHEQTAAVAIELHFQLNQALTALKIANIFGDEAIAIAERWKEAARAEMTAAQFAVYEKAIEGERQ